MTHTVSEVARLSGVTVRTLHHYDEIGLLEPSGRTEAGYRLYDRADLERLQNEAQTYANRVVPEARGRAAQILQVAEGYKEQAVAEAKGQSARFLKVFDEYKKAPDVTRERIYLETMERVLGGSDKLIYDGGAAGQGVSSTGTPGAMIPSSLMTRQQGVLPSCVVTGWSSRYATT